MCAGVCIGTHPGFMVARLWLLLAVGQLFVMDEQIREFTENPPLRSRVSPTSSITVPWCLP